MKLTGKDASEILVSDFIEEYNKVISVLYSESVNLNTNIFIINKIRDFPFDIFCRPDQTTFFTSVLKNFYDQSILSITKIITDTGKDTYTLRRLKNQITVFVKKVVVFS